MNESTPPHQHPWAVCGTAPHKLTISVSREVMQSLAAAAFVAGVPIEEVASLQLSGCEHVASSCGELLSDALCLVGDDADVSGIAARLRAYRDANRLNCDDYFIENLLAEFTGELSKSECDLLNRAGWIMSREASK